MPEKIDPESLPRRQVLLKALEDFEFNSLVDIGCGYAEDLKLIEERFGVTGWGIEPDADKTVGIEHFRILNCSATILQNKIFKDNSIDIVISDAAIMYIEWPAGVLKEMYRICRKAIVMIEQVSDYMRQALEEYDHQMTPIPFWSDKGQLIIIRK